MKRSILLFIFITFCTLEMNAQKQNLPSGVYEWEKVSLEKTQTGEKGQVLDGPTKTLNNFEINVHTLNPGKAQYNSDNDQDREALVLIKEGKLEVTINGKKSILGPGSISLAAIGDKYNIYNASDEAVTYYSIQWESKVPTDLARSRQAGGSVAFDYTNMNFEKNQKGGRRTIMRRPTATLRELEAHITTLNEGEKSHDPHVHFDEEIIVVLSGKVEEMINGSPYKVGPGSVIFLSSMDPHGIRNIGKGQCEYYAIRWLSTPE